MEYYIYFHKINGHYLCEIHHYSIIVFIFTFILEMTLAAFLHYTMILGSSIHR